MSLLWMFKQNAPTSARVARWIIFLQGFNFSIQYKKGKCHTNADAISRNPVANIAPSVNSLSAQITTKDIFKLQRSDPDLYALIYYLEKNKLSPEDGEPHRTSAIAEHYFIEDNGLLYKHTRKNNRSSSSTQLVVPRDLKSELLTWSHDDPTSGGHLGLQKTFDKITRNYYWDHIYNDVRFWEKSCTSCSTRKNQKVRKKRH